MKKLHLYALYFGSKYVAAPKQRPFVLLIRVALAKSTSCQSATHSEAEPAKSKYERLVTTTLHRFQNNAIDVAHDICYCITIGDARAVQQRLDDNILPNYLDQHALKPLMCAVDKYKPYLVGMRFRSLHFCDLVLR